MANQRDPNTFGTGHPAHGVPGQWEPTYYGYMPGYGDVTFQSGVGPNTGETLIRDGHVSMEQFNASLPNGGHGHNHYNGLGDGIDRGFYRGPGR